MIAAKARRALVNVCLAIVYSAVYVWCYVAFLYPNYDYVGFDLFPRDAGFFAISLILAVVPTLCFRGTRAASSAIAVFVYLLLYVPVIFTFAFSSDRPEAEIVSVQAVFMLSMVLLFLCDVVVIKNPFGVRGRYNLMPFVFAATAASMVYMLFVYRGNLGFSSFGEDLYEMREQNASVGADLITRYLSSWLATVLVPLCLAYGLTARRLRYAILGALACLTLYVCSANKISILTPIIYVLFFAVSKDRLMQLFPLVSTGLSGLVAILIMTATLGPVAFLISALILMRTIGNGGQLTVAYYDFFAIHPRTGYSHVNVLNLVTQRYPYGDLGLGQVVGGYYWGPYMNANANFWATDGIAAVGLVGVVVASIVLVLVLAMINSITRSYEPMFVLLCFLPFVIGILNASVFTAVWSGGGLFLLLFFILQAKHDSFLQRVQRA